MKIGHRFLRGMMRSRAASNICRCRRGRRRPDTQHRAAGRAGAEAAFAAYEALKRARSLRQPLDLDLPERQIVLSDDGKVLSVAFKNRLEAHRLIEEFMVLANVAAAEELQRLKQPLLFRVHEEPSPDKLDALREVAEASGFTLAKGQVLKTSHLNPAETVRRAPNSTN
jgi:ribonuclease R